MNPAAPSRNLREQELTRLLSQVLGETAFDNRYSLHPRRFGEIAAEIASCFLSSIDNPTEAAAGVCSRRYADEGLGERTVIRLASCARRFCLQELGWSQATLDLAEAFTEPFLEGYMAGREQQILQDQERTRRALAAAVERQGEAGGR
jgi:hypothetical protein